MCARFIEALPEGWTSYAETAGWDILLVRAADGFQIGIQAKLKMGVDVINQVLEDRGRWYIDRAGPDCRAVLVPDERGFRAIADYIGFTIITVRPEKSWGNSDFYPALPDQTGTEMYWHEWMPVKRHDLPEYVPDVAAGASAPLQLTDWKIAAIKIAVTIEIRGYVTRMDFKAHRIDHRRWTARESGWLVIEDGRYIRGPRFPNFRHGHPVVYEQIKADAPKWWPPTLSSLV